MPPHTRQPGQKTSVGRTLQLGFWPHETWVLVSAVLGPSSPLIVHPSAHSPAARRPSAPLSSFLASWPSARPPGPGLARWASKRSGERLCTQPSDCAVGPAGCFSQTLSGSPLHPLLASCFSTPSPGREPWPLACGGHERRSARWWPADLLPNEYKWLKRKLCV